MCSIGFGNNTPFTREKSVRGTSLLGVIEGIVPPRSPRSLLAYGPLVVTLVHGNNGGMKNEQLSFMPNKRSRLAFGSRSTVAEEPFSLRLPLVYLAFGIAAMRGN